jgi:hypothetical protein
MIGSRAAPGPDDLSDCFTIVTGADAERRWAALRQHWIDALPEVARLRETQGRAARIDMDCSLRRDRCVIADEVVDAAEPIEQQEHGACVIRHLSR